MFVNYIKIAFRNLVKHKGYTIINIIGLSIGIACFILISLYVLDEVSYDKYHEKADRTYRVINIIDFEGVSERSTSSPFPLGPTIALEYPEWIESATRIFNDWSTTYYISRGEKGFNEPRFFFVDSTIFDVFSIPLIEGDPKSLSKPNTVILTESTTKKYFGDENPIGKKITFSDSIKLMVAGIAENAPSNTHFRYDFLASFETLKRFYRGALPKTWVWNPCWTYISLKDNVYSGNLKKELPEFVEKYFYGAEKDNITLKIQPLTDIHLKSNLDYEIEPNGNMLYVRILMAIALFVLIIASINFMNIATALSTGRAKEIGVKKVLGAHRSQLILQFLGESLILTFFSLIIALMAVELIIPSFNNFTNKELSSITWLNINNLLLLILFSFVVGIISGLYPAIFLSSFNPVKVLGGRLKMGAKSQLPRKILVILQFSISVFLIIGTIITFMQLRHLRNADLGFHSEHVILLPVKGTPIVPKYESFKDELLQSPDIKYVTKCDYPVGTNHNTHEFKPEGFPYDEWQFYPTLVGDHDFCKTFDIEIVAGRDYNEKNKTDAMYGILINEAMVDHLGWGKPEDVIGYRFHSISGKEKVIGVFKNFHAKSLHSEIKPMVINIKENPYEINFFTEYVIIRSNKGGMKKALTFASDKWKEFAPNRPFEYKILDEELRNLYSGESILSNIAFIFTIIALVIAGLGLFGLVSFLAEQKTKEISIRKVLGSSIGGIIRLLSKEFSLYIVISIILAWVASYLILSKWLNNFAYSIGLNYGIFILAGVIVFVFAFVIIAFRGITAASKNPAETLKYE